jgi:hypothetical protein
MSSPMPTASGCRPVGRGHNPGEAVSAPASQQVAHRKPDRHQGKEGEQVPEDSIADSGILRNC